MKTKRQAIDSMRKNPRQQRAGFTISTIFDTTTQLLQREAAEKISTNKIAEYSGFSIGTIYQYFRNKDALLLALAQHERDRVVLAIKEALKDGEQLPAEETVRRIVGILLRLFSAQHHARRRLLLALLKTGNTAPFIGVIDDVGEYIAIEIRRHARTDLRALPPAAIYVMTRALLGAIRGAVLEDSPMLNQPEFEDELVRLMCSYVLVAQTDH